MKRELTKNSARILSFVTILSIIAAIIASSARMPARPSEGATATAANAIRSDAVPSDAVPPGSGCIALTFDDGPYAGVTSHILDVLEKHSVRATFFVLGSRVAGREETLLRMANLGCEIGNHTYSHADLTRLSAKDCAAEIEKTDAEFRRVLGRGAKLLRPPFGSYNRAVRTACAYPLVLWSVDTEDWRPQPADELARRVIGSAFDGAIILMHDQQKSTADAIDAIIPALIEQGFTFVTVSELIEIKGELKAVQSPIG